MKLAVLYDIHGNLAALEAVVAAAELEEVDGYVLGGDLVAFGPQPRETYERLLELSNATWIRGNTDRWLLDLPEDRPDARDRVVATRDAIGDEIAEALYQLPEQVRIDRVLYCHASPLNDMETFSPDPEPDERRLLGRVRDTTVVFGHSHLQFRRPGPQGVKLVNPGSVGMSADGDTAAWMLRRADGGLEFRRTPF